jgi:F420-dependent oxidoreductase-like protein
MHISMTVGLGARTETTIEGLIARGLELRDEGFHGMWMPNAFGFDAMTALAVVGSQVNGIEIGTAVVPTFPRHPVVMAQQALTAQAACGGRFVLGIGLSHQVMMEGQLGLSFEKPARHMREYLSVLAPLLRGEAVSFAGTQYRVEAAVTVASAPPVPLLVAALGETMLRLAGTLADGTITSWVGPKTIAAHVAPRITAAAREAGRGAPRVVVGLPIAVTDDVDGARAQLAGQAAWYNSLPSYRAMLDREGVAGPADVALIGDPASLDGQLARLEEAGATEFAAQVIPMGPGTVAQTMEYLRERAGVSSPPAISTTAVCEGSLPGCVARRLGGVHRAPTVGRRYQGASGGCGIREMCWKSTSAPLTVAVRILGCAHNGARLRDVAVR